MQWSPQQEAALKAVTKWAKAKGGPQIFRLFGYAGTGKTTLAKEIASSVRGKGRKVLFGAFTGKAALVLQSKGCTGASTIHSMIYRLEDDTAGVPRFVLNYDSPVRDAKLVVIDECSMVGEDLGRDLMSFGTKILVLGDPAQLPPVKSAGFFTNEKPDIMLTEVHRQARDNPIIRMSMDVREGRQLSFGTHGESRVVPRSEINAEEVQKADQILVGLNRTRRLYNDRMRRLKDIDNPMPEAGERLVCLRNNRTKGLLNGGIWNVEKVHGVSSNCVHMHLSPEDAGSAKKHVEVHVHPYFFEGRENDLDWVQRRESDEFDFGYCLTVHKAQGSQWENVILFDEGGAFREDRSRWLYTGITRAAKQVTVVM